MIPRHRYKYLISYIYEAENNKTGQGSSIINTNKRILSGSDKRQIETKIAKDNELKNVAITNFILMI